MSWLLLETQGFNPPELLTISSLSTPSERRLAAIMFTDIVGYSALAQQDEAKALQMLGTYREVLRSAFSRHRGREVKTMGDGFLIEFPSALEATLCAVDVQGGLNSQNLERGEKLQARIGVHLGDVVSQGGDLLGDAVNVASRIEPLARPGGICVTGEVLSHVRNKVPYPMVRIENAILKNIREKIDVYALVLPWEEKGDPENHPIPNLNRKRVAVLPLVSLSPDPNDEYFADGITEELISTMSNITGLQVISRTSVMQFKRTTKPMAEIA